jgi:ribonucleoside-diphosphate reductase alpha chain
MLAWKKGLKSLYYVRSEAIKRADVVSEQKPREKLIDYDKENTCLSCEG